MTSFLKGLLKGRQSKHKKLLEDWTTAEKENDDLEGVASGSEASRSGASRSGTSRAGTSRFGTSRFGAPRFGTSRPVASRPGGSGRSGSVESGSSGSFQGEASDEAESSNFYVKYLGSTLVSTPNGHLATADAIRAVIAMTKLSGKKLRRVTVNINLKGIRVTDTETNAVQFDISIYRISYCSADATYNHVFAFIASNSNETMECHAFLCRRKKLAQHATLTIARTFHTAFELWQLSHEGPPAECSSPAAVPKKPDPRKKPEKGRLDPFITGYKTKKCPTGAGKKKQVDNIKPLIDFSDDLADIMKKEKSWVRFDDDEIVNPKKIPNKQCAPVDLKEFDPLGEKHNNADLAEP